MYPFKTLHVCYRHIEMCMSKFNDAKIVYDKFTPFKLSLFSTTLHMDDSAYFVKSTPPRVFGVSF